MCVVEREGGEGWDGNRRFFVVVFLRNNTLAFLASFVALVPSSYSLLWFVLGPEYKEQCWFGRTVDEDGDDDDDGGYPHGRL